MTKPDLSPVTALVDARYQREEALKQAGLKSFTPALRFQEDFCETEDELREYRQFTLRSHKNHIVKDEAFVEELVRLRDQAARHYEETGNLWDNQFTIFEQHLQKMRVTDDDGLRAMMQPYKQEMERLWREEVPSFGQGYMAGLMAQGKREPSRTALYKKLMGEGLKALGFEPDREASTTRQLAYAKALPGPHKLCFLLDLVNLRQPVGYPARDERTGEIFPPPGPKFEVWLEPRETSDSKGSRRMAGIRFESLFPIREFPLGTRCYHDFYDLHELEALINVYLTMYRLIQTDLEGALVRSLDPSSPGGGRCKARRRAAAGSGTPVRRPRQ